MPITSISPFLWFNTEAEAAAQLYASLFPNSEITRISRYNASMPMPEGTVMVIAFTLLGQRFQALNGGPAFTLTEAFSLVVTCTEQAEIDHLWATLADGGKTSACGWLKDRFGLFWQINYAGLPDLLGTEKSGRVMQAMMHMTKIDIAALKQAAER